MRPTILISNMIVSAMAMEALTPFLSRNLTTGNKIKERSKPAERGIKIDLPKKRSKHTLPIIKSLSDRLVKK